MHLGLVYAWPCFASPFITKLGVTFSPNIKITSEHRAVNFESPILSDMNGNMTFVALYPTLNAEPKTLTMKFKAAHTKFMLLSFQSFYFNFMNQQECSIKSKGIPSEWIQFANSSYPHTFSYHLSSLKSLSIESEAQSDIIYSTSSFDSAA